MDYENKKIITLGTFSVIYNNWIPYAVGCLISYCKTIPEINRRYFFNDPLYEQKPITEYKEILKSTDILGLTCYVWNQGYNDFLAQYFKTLNPKGVVVYGGPQVPEDPELKVEFDQRPYLDKSIAGLGEIAFSEFLLNLPESNAVLTDMPVPYLDSTFDNLLAQDKDFKISFETNRGCPFSCSFCDWGGQARSKITKFNLEKIYKTIETIYTYKNISELEILDANFGIFPRDIDIIDKMIECQVENNNYLKISYSGLVKNGSNHLPIIMEKIFNNMPVDQRNLKISFQTHSHDVLKLINRSNINNNKLIPLIDEFKKKDIPTTSEMIIALPGETANSWLDTLHCNYQDMQIDFVRTYILHVVANTPLYTDVKNKNYGIKSKKIMYKNNEVEIIHQCNSYDLDEIKLMFSYFWLFNTLINTNILKNNVKNVKHEIKFLYENINTMPFIKNLLDCYLALVEKVFEDISITELDTSLEINFFNNTLRGSEIEQILNNKELFLKELSQYYDNLPDIKFNKLHSALSVIC
jgi:radical SAM superfamily enzyme